MARTHNSGPQAPAISSCGASRRADNFSYPERQQAIDDAWTTGIVDHLVMRILHNGLCYALQLSSHEVEHLLRALPTDTVIYEMSTGISPPSFSNSPLESSAARQRWEGEYMAWRPPTIANTNTNTNDAPSTNTNGSIVSHGPEPAATLSRQIHPSVLPNGKMSLAGISIRAFLLGVALGISLIATIILLIWHSTPLWRLPFFISSLCLFHFLEFWVTAQYNTRDADVSAFLLTANGAAYNIAHGSAILECFVWHYLLAPKQGEGGGEGGGGGGGGKESWYPTVFLILGLAAMIVGQIVRTVAMATAGSNFNHVVQARHREDHVLVTVGVYSLLRHPSYFGFFWWGLGSQLVMQNVVCFAGYAVVLWKFFSSRIQREERFLIAFFGDDYISYKSRTPVGIPFIT